MTQTILCIGQSDSGAGTGIQGDIKTAAAHGVFATTVITTIMAQNTRGTTRQHILPVDMISAQITAILDDFNPQVIKLGMLGTTEIIDCIGDFLDEKKAGLQVVIDPVMTNRAGQVLLDKMARDALKRRLLIHADVFTPNVSEVHELTGVEIKDIDQMMHAGEMLHTLGAKTVILKGGGLPGEKVFDLFLSEDKEVMMENDRSSSCNTHGAGTTLSTGIASGIAKGFEVYESFVNAHEFMLKAIEAGPKIGGGKTGPLNHMVQG